MSFIVGSAKQDLPNSIKARFKLKKIKSSICTLIQTYIIKELSPVLFLVLIVIIFIIPMLISLADCYITYTVYLINAHTAECMLLSWHVSRDISRTLPVYTMLINCKQRHGTTER